MASQQTLPPRTVVVVGAGPVGCLSAIALAKAGWNVSLFDSRSGNFCIAYFLPTSSYKDILQICVYLPLRQWPSNVQ